MRDLIKKMGSWWCDGAVALLWVLMILTAAIIILFPFILLYCGLHIKFWPSIAGELAATLIPICIGKFSTRNE